MQICGFFPGKEEICNFLIRSQMTLEVQEVKSYPGEHRGNPLASSFVKQRLIYVLCLYIIIIFVYYLYSMLQ